MPSRREEYAEQTNKKYRFCNCIYRSASDPKAESDILAEAMHYSKYHLHRIFTDTVGLTIHDYIQRRRLSEAAKLLIFSEKSVLDIALLAGYESQQAFYGCVYQNVQAATGQI